MPLGGLLKGMSEGKHLAFRESRAHYHEADGHVVVAEAAGQGKGRDAEGVEIGGVLQFGVARLVAEFALDGIDDGTGCAATSGKDHEIDVLRGEGVVDGAAEELKLPGGLDVLVGAGFLAVFEIAPDGDLIEAFALLEELLVVGVHLAASTGAAC